MSTDTTPDRLQWFDRPDFVAGRFQRRIEPPDPLHGPPDVNYPACDGRPVADNTLQDQWMDKIKGGLDALFRDDPDVFVAANLMWYPVEGNNRRRLAPDAMVAFGRPKGYRDSYVQHQEDDVAPQVVLEILSPGNRKRVMDFKRRIYEMYGIEEYYVFDPYKIRLEVWILEDEAFRLIPEASGWVSPRLGIRFELGEDLTIYAPDGRPFLHYAEVFHQRDQFEQRADAETQRADAETQRADAETQRADAQERATNQERQRANAERERAERLAARLRELGLEPDE